MKITMEKPVVHFATVLQHVPIMDLVVLSVIATAAPIITARAVASIVTHLPTVPITVLVATMAALAILITTFTTVLSFATTVRMAIAILKDNALATNLTTLKTAP